MGAWKDIPGLVEFVEAAATDTVPAEAVLRLLELVVFSEVVFVSFE